MRPGIVYFIQAPSGPLKIGFTRNLLVRFSTLQVGNHEPLTLLAAAYLEREVESDLHARFHRFLIRGEWFEPHAEVLDYAQSLPTELTTNFNVAHMASSCFSCQRKQCHVLELSKGQFESLCRRCLMARDGRLEKFVRFVSQQKTKKPKAPCSNCGRSVKPLRRGRCGMCNEHLRKHGEERPKGAQTGQRLFCAKGHPLQGDNVGVAKNGKRFCRVCPIRNRQRKWQHQCDAERRGGQPV